MNFPCACITLEQTFSLVGLPLSSSNDLPSRLPSSPPPRNPTHHVSTPSSLPSSAPVDLAGHLPNTGKFKPTHRNSKFVSPETNFEFPRNRRSPRQRNTMHAISNPGTIRQSSRRLRGRPKTVPKGLQDPHRRFSLLRQNVQPPGSPEASATKRVFKS